MPESWMIVVFALLAVRGALRRRIRGHHLLSGAQNHRRRGRLAELSLLPPRDTLHLDHSSRFGRSAGSSATGLAGARAAGTGRPIVLIHGWTQNRTNFVWLARFLRRRGLGPFFGFNYFSFQPIEQSAKSLAAFIERVVAHTGAKEIDLVCHSLGGLVARTYVDLMGGHSYVQRVVTLGTPHCGVAYANPRFGPSVRDMHSETGFVVELGRSPLPPTVSYLSIYSAHDNIVYPGTASCLGKRGTDVRVSGFGHFGILFCEQVAEHVHRALAAEARASCRSIPLEIRCRCVEPRRGR